MNSSPTACGIALSCVLLASTAFNATWGAEVNALSEIKLGPNELYAGYDARKVLPDKQGGMLRLDPRVFGVGKERKGWVVTDPLALLPAPGGIGAPGSVDSVEIEVAAEVPEGATAFVEARSGPTCLDESGWSQWQKVEGLKGRVGDLAGRYAQVRVTLTANTQDKLPGLSAVILRPGAKPASPWKKTPKLAEDKILKIVRSPIVFHQERPTQPRLAEFRKKAKLDEVIADGKDDFEKLVKLMDWVGSCANERPKGGLGGKFYPWDVDKVVKWQDDKPVILGHCMSYSETMVSAACSLGYKARHVSSVGFREMSHETVEAWVPNLNKWVYFDPSLANYYFNLETKEPLNVLQIHNIIAETFLDEGKDMKWFIARESDSTKKKVKKIGGMKPIGARLGGWKYGAPMEKDYNWGWSHGYLVHGYFQMTPRNDFYSNPDAVCKRFGSLPGYDNFPFWVDDKTPPKKGGENWFTRPRDFYWSVDQASFALVRSGTDGKLTVELGNCMPFFDKYEIKIDGAEVKQPKGATLEWTLKTGKNRLEVAPVDEFGKKGSASSAVVEY